MRGEALSRWGNEGTGNAEGTLWYGRGQGRPKEQEDSGRRCPTETPQSCCGSAHCTELSAPEGKVWLSHGVAVVLFFQFRQHPRQTGGGLGVKGNILSKHGSRWRWGTHSCACPGVGSSDQLCAWPWLAQFNSAWLGWSGSA